MGLDAFVYCDCFETGRLKAQPSPRNGRYVSTQIVRERLALRTSILSLPLTYGRIAGRVLTRPGPSTVSEIFPWVRFCEQSSRNLQTLDLILNKVIYDGIHAGDFIPADDVIRLQDEVEHLTQVHVKDSSTGSIIRHFERR